MTRVSDIPSASRVAVIGLDCAPPSLVFDRWAADMPSVTGLAAGGFAGRLTSTIPPITVPAWTSMVTGLDPGELGLYGFRNRDGYHNYDLRLADYGACSAPRLWDFMGRAGKKSIILGVPLTWPPPEIQGLAVSCFLAPGRQADFTRPQRLKHDLDRWAGGEYLLDVDEFRTEDKDRLARDIFRMTRARFAAAERLLQEEWDFFMMVEMGPDRLHHGFWRHIDPHHPRYDPAGPYGDTARRYYRELDGLVGRLLSRMPKDTLVLVVSDHGARSMNGGVALNRWLADQGFLTLKTGRRRGPLTPEMVDWPRTRAWGAGGYYGRIFFNVKGRDAEGVLSPREYDDLRDETAGRLEDLADEDGRPLNNVCLRPGRIYRRTNGYPPDLMLLAGGLGRRVLGSPDGPILQAANDTGPDDANHSMEGIIIGGITGRELPEPPGGRMSPEPFSIYQAAPTVLESLGLGRPASMAGRPITPGA